MVRHRRSDSVMLHDSNQTVAVRLLFNGGSEVHVFRMLRTPGSLKLNIKVNYRPTLLVSNTSQRNLLEYDYQRNNAQKNRRHLMKTLTATEVE